MRTSHIERKTKETEIALTLNVNGTGCSVSVHCGPGTLGIIYMVEP